MPGAGACTGPFSHTMGSTILNAKAFYSWLVCAHLKSMVAHVPRSGLFIRTGAPHQLVQLSHSSAASSCWGGLKAWLKEPTGAVILGRELDRHLANQRLSPRLLLLVFVRRRRDPFFPFLYERADGGGEDGAHEPAARAILDIHAHAPTPEILGSP